MNFSPGSTVRTTALQMQGRVAVPSAAALFSQCSTTCVGAEPQRSHVAGSVDLGAQLNRDALRA